MKIRIIKIILKILLILMGIVVCFLIYHFVWIVRYLNAIN